MCCNIVWVKPVCMQTLLLLLFILPGDLVSWFPWITVKEATVITGLKQGGVYCRNNLNIYGFYPSDVSDLIHLRFQWTFSYSLMNVLNWFNGFDLCKGGHTMSICKSYFAWGRMLCFISLSRLLHATIYVPWQPPASWCNVTLMVSILSMYLNLHLYDNVMVHISAIIDKV